MYRYFIPFLLILSLNACSMDKFIGARTTTHGYQFNPEMLELIPEGSSREHVMLSLGTPNTTQINKQGNEIFYYITQKQTRKAAFLKPEIVEQKVLAIHFSSDEVVESIKNYDLSDGKVFAFNNLVTSSGGKELSLFGQLLQASQSVLNPFAN